MTTRRLHAFALLHSQLLLSAGARPAVPSDRAAAVESLGDVTVRFGIVPNARAGKAAALHDVVARDAHGRPTPEAELARWQFAAVSGYDYPWMRHPGACHAAIAKLLVDVRDVRGAVAGSSPL